MSNSIRPRRLWREEEPRQSLVITGVARTKPRGGFAIVASLLVLVMFWIVCFFSLLTGSSQQLSLVSDVHQIQRYSLRGDLPTNNKDKRLVAPKSHLVSRMPNKVVATADVRGNLGPASVVIQAKPGSDWLHDRWQAASNMHGKQIPGEHWIELEFQNTTVVADKIVLDWETAYADEYVLEASMDKIANNPTNQNVWILFDGRKQQDVDSMRSVTELGRSPGVQEKRPLHVVHELVLKTNENHNKAFRYLRLHILKSKTGWGVSLWQFDVYGLHADELQISR